MDKNLIIRILIIIVVLSPTALFALTLSRRVMYINNWGDLDEGQEDFNIETPTPLLGNKYKLIVGNYFSAFQGIVTGNITIMSKATEQNQSFQIYIDATTDIASWDSDHHALILPPGEYTIFWQLTPFAPTMQIYTHGWFMTDNDDPQNVNGIQILIIMITGFIGGFISLAIILSLVRKRREGYY